MKRHIILITLLASLSKSILTMEMDNRDSRPEQHLANIPCSYENIIKISQLIDSRFLDHKNDSPEDTLNLYNELANILALIDFSNPLNTPFRTELMGHIRQLEAEFFPIDNSRTREELTNELIQILENNSPCNIQEDSDDDSDNEEDIEQQIIELILAGADTNAKISYQSGKDMRSIPILNFLLGFDIYTDLVPLLLIYGANPNYGDINTELPIVLAARNHHIEFLNQLVNFGADVNSTDHLRNSFILQLGGILD
jgi:hypothetical protein